jgi:hypothetical protein
MTLVAWSGDRATTGMVARLPQFTHHRPLMSTESLPSGARPASPPSATVVKYDQYIDTRIGKTRRAVRTVELASVLVALAVGVLGFLLTVALVEHWLLPGGFGMLGRSLLFTVLVGGTAYYVYRHVWPLCVRRINPVYAAQAIEQGSPSLKNSLVNLLLFRQRRTELAPAVYDTLEEQAAQRLTRVPADTVVDRTQLIRLGYVLVAVVAAAALYWAFSPKDPLITAERVLLPWADVVPASRVMITAVEPGTTTIARGQFVDVSADVRGLSDDDTVLVRYTTDDGQAVDKAIAMSTADAGPRFQCRLPSEDEPGESVGVTQNLRYRIEAGDARSREYKITVVAAPTILVRSIDYKYPDYTGYANRHVDDLGDIRAIEGTRVTIHARANGPIDEAYIDFDADGRRDVRMTVDGSNAQASFTLALRRDRRTPQHTSYALRYTNTEGRSNREPVRHPIDVLPDRAPEIELVEPAEKTRDVRLDETITIGIDARDADFALSAVRLQGTVFGRQALDEQLLAAAGTRQLIVPGAGSAARFTGRYQFTPNKHDLKAGDVVELWAVAHDNRTPEPNTATSERKLLRITSPEPVRQPQPQPDQMANRQPGAGQPGQQPQDQQQQNGGGSQQPSSRNAQRSADDQPQQPNEGQQGGNQSEGGQSQQDDSQSDGQSQTQPGSAEGAGGQAKPSGEDRVGQQADDQQSAEPGQQEGSRNGEQEQTGVRGAAGERSNEGTPPAGTQSDQPPPAGSQPGKGGEPATPSAEPTPVSPEGDNDAEAFDRIRRHMNRSGEPNDQADRPQSQQQPGGWQQPRRNVQQSADDARQQPSGDTKPPTDEPAGSTDQSPAPSGQPTGSEGASGAGEQPSANQGAPDSQPEMKPTDKQQQTPSTDEQPSDQEPPMAARGERQSDSQGEQGGDRMGGGTEGSGQQAPHEGTGSTGQNQSADNGAGESSEQGAGANSSDAGGDAPAAGQTGQQGSDSPGEGTGQRNGEGNKPGGQPGKPSADNQQQGQPQPGQPSDGQRAPGEGTQPSEGDQPPNQPGDQPGDATGAPTGGGGRTGTSNAPPPPASGSAPEADDANLEYARQETDLVLEKLADQLDRKQVDQQLLDQLGWSEDDLRKFVERWQERMEAAKADTPAADPARRELDEALRSLGLRRGPLRQDSQPKDQMRDLGEGYRGSVPLEYQEHLRAYSEGVSRARQAEE